MVYSCMVALWTILGRSESGWASQDSLYDSGIVLASLGMVVASLSCMVQWGHGSGQLSFVTTVGGFDGTF